MDRHVFRKPCIDHPDLSYLRTALETKAAR